MGPWQSWESAVQDLTWSRVTSSSGHINGASLLREAQGLCWYGCQPQRTGKGTNSRGRAVSLSASLLCLPEVEAPESLEGLTAAGRDKGWG